jgi:alkanesulfonate monooxygenase SsuD/methylene tetrahydromethanopterin reductase-like flavin-dependent oxidoreductase (luciferase family)
VGRHHRLRVGLQLPEVERTVPWREHVAMARAAERAGFDSIWLGDHLLYRDDGREERGPWDAWSMLSGLAAVTSHVRLGPLVACTAFAPAWSLARRAAAVQEISGGRFVLGLGAGWNETEFRGFGLPFDHRASRFEEAFDVVRRLLAGERVTVRGRFEHLADAVLLPPPSVPVPLLVGSIGERVLLATLPHVDVWNAWFGWYGNTADGFAAANEQVTALATSVGRAPASIERTATVLVHLDDGGTTRPHAREAPPLHGTPDELVSQLADFATAGLDEAILVVEPITEHSIRALGATITALRS